METHGGSTTDDRFVLVGMDRYLAAGGRVAADLFGELPDSLLDPEILQSEWKARIQPIIDHFKPRAWRSISAAPRPAARRKLPHLPYVYPGPQRRPDEGLSRGEVPGSPPSSANCRRSTRCRTRRRRRRQAASPSGSGRRAPVDLSAGGAVILCPADGYGVSAAFYGAPIPASERPEEPDEDEDEATTMKRPRLTTGAMGRPPRCRGAAA